MYLPFKPTHRVDFIVKATGSTCGYTFYNEVSKDFVFQVFWSSWDTRRDTNFIVDRIGYWATRKVHPGRPEVFSVGWWNDIRNITQNPYVDINQPIPFDLSDKEETWRFLMNKVKFQWFDTDKVRIYISRYNYGEWTDYELWYEDIRLPEYKVIELLRDLRIEVEEETIDKN